MPDDSPTNGGSTVQRLERIEKMLDRLDDKLDIKADRADVHVLSARVAVLELEYVKHATKWESLAPEFRQAEKDIVELQRAQVVTEAKADKAEEIYQNQGFKLDTTTKKVLAFAAVAAIVLNTIDSILQILSPGGGLPMP